MDRLYAGEPLTDGERRALIRGYAILEFSSRMGRAYDERVARVGEYVARIEARYDVGDAP